ncbi:MAG TPA: beta-ketoacyl-[acyl-carrier-protein] synthase family protein [Hyphomicrobiales bacterium]|jgi:3-oxoacyl-[acyl-carrier-protein] synthase II
MKEKRRVLVTGLGLATPLGLSVEENWRKVFSGISGITELDLPSAAHCPIRIAGRVGEADWRTIVDEFPEEARTEGERRTLFALWAAQRAWIDAGLADRRVDTAGVAFASGLGICRLEDIHRWSSDNGGFDFVRFAREREEVSPESIMRNFSHRPAALIAGKYSLGGPNFTVSSACASATQAIGLGYRAIQDGETDLMVTGGADSMINPAALVGFALLQAASPASGPPEAVSRPFDLRRSGLVMGEGAGVAVLEEENHARKRGAKIYAEVAGYGSSLDAYQVTAPHPQGEGAARSMKLALRDARLEPDEIDYINAHGTGTRLNDAAETLAIKRVFEEAARRIPISSTKSMIGHLMAAAGAPEFVFTVLSVERDEIHPTINLTQPDPKCDLDYVPNSGRSRRVGAALSNSFGFGGQNATIVVKKYDGSARIDPMAAPI